MDKDSKEEESFFDLSDEFGSNPAAEVEGVWSYLGETAKVKVARLGNLEAQKAYRKIPKQVRDQIEKGNMGNKAAIQFLSKFLATHILKDWFGLSDGGKTLPAYDAEAGTEFLLKYRRFRDRIWEIAIDDDLYNVKEVEETAGNLSKRSSGSS